MKLRYRILSGVAIVVGLGVGALAVALSYDAPCERPARALLRTQPK